MRRSFRVCAAGLLLILGRAVFSAAEEARPPLLERVPLEDYPNFRDDTDFNGLEPAIAQSLAFYRSQPPDRLFILGQDSFSAAHMAESLEAFAGLLRMPANLFAQAIEERFWLYRPVRDAVFSAYYEPTVEASLRRAGKYRYPLYRPPPDLVEVEVSPGGPRLSGRRKDGKIVPYHTRRAIDSERVLRGRGLEIAWAADPVQLYFLQVQGSGWLKLPEGRMVRVRYAANNGHPYKSVGGVLIETGRIPKDKFGRAVMLDYFKAHPEETQAVLNANPRYVFFTLDESPAAVAALGSLQVPLTAGRSIATDPAVYPPGSLAYMETLGKPVVTRFVLNQDQGGAIKGPGRVDFFAGTDEDFAVRFWQAGRIYVLVKKTPGT